MGKGGRCVGLTTLPPSCADCLEIWKPQPPGTLRACPGLYRDCFTFNIFLLFFLVHVPQKSDLPIVNDKCTCVSRAGYRGESCSIPGVFVCDLKLAKLHWDRFLSDYFDYLL